MKAFLIALLQWITGETARKAAREKERRERLAAQDLLLKLLAHYEMIDDEFDDLGMNKWGPRS